MQRDIIIFIKEQSYQDCKNKHLDKAK
jgi:hypothetical protein